MKYKKAIEIYTGFEVDMINDVEIVNDGNNVYIEKWEVEGIEQPTIEQLETIYNDNVIQIKKELKEKELKDKYLNDAIDDLLKKYKPYSDRKTELDGKTTEKEIDEFIYKDHKNGR